MDNVIEIVNEYVKKHCVDVAAHDYWHIKRVYDMSKRISLNEKSSMYVVELIALLHDVFDPKFIKDVNVSNEVVELLKKLEVYHLIEENDIINICHSIENLGFKGGFKSEDLSIEGKIVQDADRLDAIGAIAIARTFAYGGKIDRPIYDPIQGIIEIKNEDEYRNLNRHTINHFYEKLLKLKDLMNTTTAKEIAEERHKFMEDYLKQFFAEWEGIL